MHLNRWAWGQESVCTGLQGIPLCTVVQAHLRSKVVTVGLSLREGPWCSLLPAPFRRFIGMTKLQFSHLRSQKSTPCCPTSFRVVGEDNHDFYPWPGFTSKDENPEITMKECIPREKGKVQVICVLISCPPCMQLCDFQLIISLSELQFHDLKNEIKSLSWSNLNNCCND